MAAGEMTVKTDANGGISIPLIPNTGASPSGSYYRVVIKLDDGTTSEEQWVVPAMATTTVAAIRAKVVPQAVAAQFVSVDTLDTELAGVVHMAGTETIQGAKTFVASPQVPAPTAAGGAANKGYVDQAMAGLATEVTISASNLTMGALPNGTTATTQAANDNSTKLATTQYVASSLASPGAIGSSTPGVVNATTVNAGMVAAGTTCPASYPAGTVCAKMVNGMINVVGYGADPTGVTIAERGLWRRCAATTTNPGAYSNTIYFPCGDYSFHELDLSAYGVT